MTGQRTPEFPMRRTDPLQPPPEYDKLCKQMPISKVTLWSGAQAWALTRHADIRAMLSDARFSSDPRKPGFPLLVDHSDMSIDLNPSLGGIDGPEHLRARRAVVGEFSARRTEALRPRIQTFVDGCIDSMLAVSPPVDLVEALALPVPSLVICELLGVPYADHKFIQTNSAKWTGRLTSPADRVAAFREIHSYLDRLVTAKERDPGDDLVGRQIAKRGENGPFDHDELVALAFILLLGGFETTTSMISLGTLALLVHTDQLEKVRTDPGKIPSAVEELLRFFSVAELAAARVAIEDAEIGGVLIRAGEGVVGLCNAGDHDPSVFERPWQLDIERPARNHLAFGFGPHQCIGQSLARLELQIVFETLFRRITGLRLAKPIEELPFKHDSTLYGLYELPVTW